MAQVNIEISDYVNAKDGSILIKKNGKWVITNFDELNKGNVEKLNKLGLLSNEVEALKKNAKHFVVYAKSHFLVVFNYFKIKILSGEVDVLDEGLLKLDEAVISGEISVEDAIQKHDLLLKVFNELYLNNKETKEFPEV